MAQQKTGVSYNSWWWRLSVQKNKITIPANIKTKVRRQIETSSCKEENMTEKNSKNRQTNQKIVVESKEAFDESRRQTFKKSMFEELHVDKDLLAYKAFYFLFFAGFGASFPYIALYFKQIGLSASLVGILAGIRPIIQFISAPFWAILADTFKARKTVLLFSILSWLVMTLALLIPAPQRTYCKNLKNDTNSTEYDAISLKLIGRTVIPVPKGENNSPIQTFPKKQPFQASGSEHVEVFALRLQELVYDRNEIYDVFIWLLILVVAGEFLEAPTFIMADTALLQKLGKKQKHYGKTRLFGSLGFAFASFVVGALLDTTEYRYCGRVVNNYNILFYTFAVIMTLAFIFAAWLFKFTYDETDVDKTAGKTMGTLTVFLKFQYAFFLTISFFLGFSNGLFFNFLNWYLEDLGASKVLMGTATFFRAAALIIAYILNAFLADLCGHVQLLLVSVSAYFVLFGTFSVIQNPLWALPLEFLEGLTYGTTWSTAVIHLADATPKGGAATMQGL